MSRILPRYLPDDTLQEQAKLGRILIATGAPAPTTLTLELANPQELRGIPCIARGVTGTSPHTDPYLAVQHWPHR